MSVSLGSITQLSGAVPAGNTPAGTPLAGRRTAGTAPVAPGLVGSRPADDKSSAGKSSAGKSPGGPGAGRKYPSVTDGQSVAALQGQIQQTRAQLDDWVTCVSAHTTKGQAEIQSLSAQLSGAESRVHRLENSASGSQVDVWA